MIKQIIRVPMSHERANQIDVEFFAQSGRSRTSWVAGDLFLHFHLEQNSVQSGSSLAVREPGPITKIISYARWREALVSRFFCPYLPSTPILRPAEALSTSDEHAGGVELRAGKPNHRHGEIFMRFPPRSLLV
jgi:hypothetical protein